MYSFLFSIFFLTFSTHAQTQKVTNPHLRCFALLDRLEREAKFRTEDKKPPIAVTMQPGRTTIAIVVPLDDFHVGVLTKNGLKTASLETDKIEQEKMSVAMPDGTTKMLAPQRRLLNMEYGDDLILDLPYDSGGKHLSAQSMSVHEETLEAPPNLPAALEKAKYDRDINQGILTKQSDEFAEECRKYNLGTPTAGNLSSLSDIVSSVSSASSAESRARGLKTPAGLTTAREYFTKSQAQVAELEKQVTEEPRVRERILGRIPEIDPKPASAEDQKTFNGVLLKQLDLFYRKRTNWPADKKESWTDNLKKECGSVPWSEDQKAEFAKTFL